MRVTKLTPWFMWIMATSFFAYQFVMRVAPGLVMPELMQKFHVDAASFGMFASMYYFGYAGMQIPVALLLDRYGAKRIISISAFFCAVGTLLLIYTNCWSIALSSRFIIGAGSAAAFLGTSKIIATWFPEKMYAKMIGFTFTLGLMGALYGGKPIGLSIASFGWEPVLLWVGSIGFIIAFFAYVLINDKKDITVQETAIMQRLKTIVLNKHLMTIAIANLLMVGALEGFADIWGISYFVASRLISKSDAALITSTIFFGMLFGGPLLAFIADKIKSERILIFICGTFIALLFSIMLAYQARLSDSILYAMMFIIGLLCCYQVLVFSLGVKIAPTNLSNLVVALLNCINMLGGSFFHSIIGQLMDVFWRGSYDQHHIKLYEVPTYTMALAIIPISALIGGILFIAVKDHKVKQKSH